MTKPLLPDPVFRSWLWRAYCYEQIVAWRLRAEGVHVKDPKFEVVKSHNEIPAFRDQADLWIGPAEDVRLEVKSHKRAWQGRLDFSHPMALIESVANHEDKVVKPAAYVLISRPTLGMVVVPHTTRELWVPQREWNPRDKVYEDYYFVPKGELRPFSSLVRWALELESQAQPQAA